MLFLGNTSRMRFKKKLYEGCFLQGVGCDVMQVSGAGYLE